MSTFVILFAISKFEEELVEWITLVPAPHIR
jgi:hypothetical protein